jgi:hypothetical protein
VRTSDATGAILAEIQIGMRAEEGEPAEHRVKTTMGYIGTLHRDFFLRHPNYQGSKMTLRRTLSIFLDGGYVLASLGLGETSSAGVILTASAMGVPISTTHVITSAILGVGLSQGHRKVNWTVGIRIVWAWILTIPASAAAGYLAYDFLRPIILMK